jgi:hypothetical protein
MPNLFGPPFLLPACAILVAWNVLAGLNVSSFCCAPPVTSLSSGGEEGGSTGGGLERKAYGLGVEIAISSSPLLADVGLVDRGVVRSLKFESCDGLGGGMAEWCCSPEREVERFEMSLRGLETWRTVEAGCMDPAWVSGTLNVRVNSTDFVSVVASFGFPKKDIMLAEPSAALFFLTGALRASMSRSLASSCAEFSSGMREEADVTFGGIDIDAVEKPAGFCIVTLEAGMNPATGTVGALCCSIFVLRLLFA